MYRSIRNLKRAAEDLAKTVKVDFSVYEQEFIRRIIKAVYSQINDEEDRRIARDILERTDWLEQKNNK